MTRWAIPNAANEQSDAVVELGIEMNALSVTGRSIPNASPSTIALVTL